MKVNQEVQDVLNAALQEAKQRNHEYLTPEHVLYAALHFQYPRDVLSECGVEPDDVRAEIDKHLKEKVPVIKKGDPVQSLGFQNVIQRAVFHTQAAQKEEVDLGDIIVSIFDEDQSFGAYFLRKATLWRSSRPTLPSLRKRASLSRSSAGKIFSSAPCRYSAGV
jgi:ATP-dependent Clp protease ATP-binding subunit ClpA